MPLALGALAVSAEPGDNGVAPAASDYQKLRALAPLVLHSNELIRADTKRLARLRHAGPGGHSSEVPAGGSITTAVLDELRVRVDIIPTSLPLSQAAEESGRGTTRFAAQGNALFGQWTWGEAGMNPEDQRARLGDDGLATYVTSLRSLMTANKLDPTDPAYLESGPPIYLVPPAPKR